jgi:hypothetical protein
METNRQINAVISMAISVLKNARDKLRAMHCHVPSRDHKRLSSVTWTTGAGRAEARRGREENSRAENPDRSLRLE